MTAETNESSVFVVSDEATVMSPGRLFHSFEPAEANDCSPMTDGR